MERERTCQLVEREWPFFPEPKAQRAIVGREMKVGQQWVEPEMKCLMETLDGAQKRQETGRQADAQ